MRNLFGRFIFLLVIAFCLADNKKFLQGDNYECIKCLCHARSGCYSRINCARYSVSFEYWKTAGSIVVDPDDNKDSQESYEKCKKDEACIVGTIMQYTDKFLKDCNCDGNIDCKDRAAIHLFGENCFNPNYGATYAQRFNTCKKSAKSSLMLNKEGNSNCEPEAV